MVHLPAQRDCGQATEEQADDEPEQKDADQRQESRLFVHLSALITQRVVNHVRQFAEWF